MEKPKIKLSELSQEHLANKLAKLSAEVANNFGKTVASEFEGESMTFVLDNLTQVLIHSFSAMLFDLYHQAYQGEDFKNEQENFKNFVVKNTDFKLQNFFDAANKKENKDNE